MIKTLQLLKQFANQHALMFCFTGVVLAAWHNWRLWQKDRALLVQKITPATTQPLDIRAHLPKVSFLVAGWNEAQIIQEHIESLLKLDYPNKELILCIGGKDGSYDIARKYTRGNVVVLEQLQGEGKQTALQRCLGHSAGSIVFLTDADCILGNNSFHPIADPVINGEEYATTGSFAPLQNQRNNPFIRMQWYVDHYRRRLSPKYIEGFIGRGAAVSRAVLDQVGGFNEPIPTGTDYYLARKLVAAGIPIRFIKDSSIETVYHHSIFPYLRQQSRWLRNILLHGQAFKAKRQVYNAFMQCILGLSVILWPITFLLLGWSGVAVWLAALSHGVFSRFRYIRYAERSLSQAHHRDVYLLAPVYLLVDQVMLSFTLLEWLIPQFRRRW